MLEKWVKWKCAEFTASKFGAARVSRYVAKLLTFPSQGLTHDTLQANVRNISIYFNLHGDRLIIIRCLTI